MFVCEICECEYIQKKMWVDIETETVHDDCDTEEYFCPNCDESIKPYEIKVSDAKWQRIKDMDVDFIISILESIGVVTYKDADDYNEFDVRLSCMDSVAAGDIEV